MKCNECGRELRQDSQFCDWCGSKVERQQENKEDKKTFNLSLLISGILISILVSIILTGAAAAFGIPLLLGGLFLPFFWYKKKKS